MRIRFRLVVPLLLMMLGVTVGWIIGYWIGSMQDTAPQVCQGCRSIRSPDSLTAVELWLKGADGFSDRYEWQRMRQNKSLYYFERPGRLLPLMRLTPLEKDQAYRVAVARQWLQSQSIVIAATVRNAASSLKTSLANLARLRQLFYRSWVLMVENDSTDRTRMKLLEIARTDSNFVVLGCGTINSAQPCKVNMRYASGKDHVPGIAIKRTISDEVDRGLIMSALRNEYLNFAYKVLADQADLMLILDPDVEWQDWDLDNILQGLYYFKTRPRLQQLCANTVDLRLNLVFDPCTLTFFNNKRFGEDQIYPNVDYYKSIHKCGKELPPVKVESCFQAFTFYRLSDMRAMQAQYERSHGEWMCEHNTLSRQLQEVYIDPQMRLGVRQPNVG